MIPPAGEGNSTEGLQRMFNETEAYARYVDEAATNLSRDMAKLSGKIYNSSWRSSFRVLLSPCDNVGRPHAGQNLFGLTKSALHAQFATNVAEKCTAYLAGLNRRIFPI